MTNIDTFFENLTEIVQIITMIMLIIVFYWQIRDRKVQGAKFNSPISTLKMKEMQTSVDLGKKDYILFTAIQEIHNVGDRKAFLKILDAELILKGHKYSLQENSNMFERFLGVDQNESTTFHFNNLRDVEKSNATEDIIIIKYKFYNHKDEWKNDKFEIPLTLPDPPSKVRYWKR